MRGKVGIDAFHHFAARELRTAKPGEHLIRAIQPHVLGHGMQHLIGGLFTDLRKGRTRQFTAQFDKALAVDLTQGAPDRRLGFTRGGNVEPCHLRRLALRGGDLNRLAVFDPGPQRHAHPVDLGPHTGIADTGVDRIGEINRRGAARQFYHIAVGCEAEHLIGVHFKLHRFEEILVIGLGVELLGQLADPLGGIDGKGVPAAHPVTVRPMRGDAGLGHVMHLAGADLHLHPLAVTARDGGVDRPITVGLGLADVILEPPRHRAPAPVDRPEGAVAVFFRGGDDAKAVDVGQAGEALLLLLHLAPDRIGFLGPAKDLGFDIRLFQLYPHIAGDALDHIAGVALQGDEAANDRGARLGVEHPKGEVFKLFAHPLHAHAARQRRIDVHRLPRLFDLLVRAHGFDRAHVVQTVGELDEDDAQVLGHRHEKLAEILGLFGLGRV